ncbi:36689_t:CDS:1, partial [Racocetra persica]
MSPHTGTSIRTSASRLTHPAQFNLSQNITLCEEPILQSVNEILTAILPPSPLLTNDEQDLLKQLDTQKFN